MNIKKFSELSTYKKLRVFLYPIFLIIEIPAAWIKNIYYSQRILKGNISNYIGFLPYNSICSLFYVTQFINLKREGRAGHSKYLGLGDYSLSNWFYHSNLALKIFSKAGALSTLYGVIFWNLSNFLWLKEVSYIWVITLVIFFFISSTSYSMAFARQNYQILAWMWLPLALFNTFQGNFIIASILWMIIAALGITPIVLSIPSIFLIAINNNSFYPIIEIFFTSIIFLPRLFLIFKSGELIKSILNTSKWLGFLNHQTKYSRTIKGINIKNIYFLAIYLLPIICIYLTNGEISIFLICIVIQFILNQTKFRLADEESYYVLFSTWLLLVCINSEPSIFLLISFLIAINPLGVFLSIQHLGEPILNFKPFDHTVITKPIDNLFSFIPTEERIIAAFRNPENKYENIFDGYRTIIEAPLYIAAKRKIHLFPDWYAIYETNYLGSPDFWGIEPYEVKNNCIKWNSKYALIYQETGTKLNSKWNANFTLISEFDWGKYLSFFEIKPWPKNVYTPKWFLLKIN